MHPHKFTRNLLLFLVTLPVFFFIFFPILWLLSASFSTQVELFTVPMHWIPQHPTVQNYMDIFFPGQAASSVPRTFAVALLNSFKIASAVTVICILIGSLAAYALVRIPFGLNRSIQLGIIATRMIPEVSLILPLFIIASSLQLINKPIVLILTYMSFALPYAIWLMAAYFQTVPVELEEAARLDGCTRLGILFRVVMPISVPGLVSTAMFVLDWISDPAIWASLVTLTVLEIVLGIDNIVFISVIVGKLPPEQAKRARQIGLLMALGFRIVLLLTLFWLIRLTSPLFTVFGEEISWRDLVLFAGGLFLLVKATQEIHRDVEGGEEAGASQKVAARFGAIVAQIALIDLVFSVDSIITAIGMAEHVGVMIAAVFIAVAVMYVASGPVADFIHRHPTTRMLALAFLLMIGIALIADGAGFHIPRGYLYVAMAFSAGVEFLNVVARRNRKKPMAPPPAS